MPKKSVFIVTAGCYSDYHIVGVYETREQAEQLAATLRESNVEEHPLNPFLPELNKGLFIFFVEMKANGDTLQVKREESKPGEWDYDYKLTSTLEPIQVWKTRAGDDLVYNKRVFARDEKHAVKIMNELRVQALAKG